jgi:hypothetical protein
MEVLEVEALAAALLEDSAVASAAAVSRVEVLVEVGSFEVKNKKHEKTR